MVDVRRISSKSSTERPFLFFENTANPHAVARSRIHVSKKHACRTYPNTRASHRPSVPVRLGHDNLRIYSLFTMTKTFDAHEQAPRSQALLPQTHGKPFPALHSRPVLTGLTRHATHTRRKARRPAEIWWSQTGSNRRPHACKARALPTELWPHFGRRPKCFFGITRLNTTSSPGRRPASPTGRPR